MRVIVAGLAGHRRPPDGRGTPTATSASTSVVTLRKHGGTSHIPLGSRIKDASSTMSDWICHCPFASTAQLAPGAYPSSSNTGESNHSGADRSLPPTSSYLSLYGVDRALGARDVPGFGPEAHAENRPVVPSA